MLTLSQPRTPVIQTITGEFFVPGSSIEVNEIYQQLASIRLSMMSKVPHDLYKIPVMVRGNLFRLLWLLSMADKF